MISEFFPATEDKILSLQYVINTQKKQQSLNNIYFTLHLNRKQLENI